MAIKLQRKTNNTQLLKLVSVLDDAIDWEKTYGDESSLPRKRSRYLKEHKISDLVFAEGVQPTLFVFEHPCRVDVARKIRHLYTKQMTARDQSDIFTEVWDKSFLGTEEGLDGSAREEPARRDSHITDGYFQTLEDSGVFEELAAAVLEVANENQAVRELNKKK